MELYNNASIDENARTQLEAHSLLIQISELMQLAKTMDTLAITQAMMKMEVTDHTILREILEHAEIYHDHHDSKKVSESLSAFTRVLYEMSAMKKLNILSEETRIITREIRNLTLDNENRRHAIIHEYWDLYQGIVENDKGLVEDAIKKHYTSSEIYLYTHLDTLPTLSVVFQEG